MELDLENPKHAAAYKCAARVFLSNLSPLLPATMIRDRLQAPNLSQLTLWQPFEQEEPMAVECWISDHALDILATYEEIDDAPF